MNDIDKIPVKCRDCPYWELASFPWCCGDCVEIMNPKNGEYIKRIDAKRALTALPPDLDAETVQRCIEAMNSPKAADVEPKQRWIPVTERLPEEKISPMTMDFTEYPCVFDGRAGQREVRYYKFGKGHFWHGSGCIDDYVTHWAEPMPLPKLPKEADNG